MANESFLGTARTRRSVIEHLRLIGYEFGTAAPAAALLSVTVPADVTATVDGAQGRRVRDPERQGPAERAVRVHPRGALTIDFGTVAADPATARKVYGGPRTARASRSRRAGWSATSARHLATARPTSASLGCTRGRSCARPAATGQTSRDVVLVTREIGADRPWTCGDTLAFSRRGPGDFALQIDADDRPRSSSVTACSAPFRPRAP